MITKRVREELGVPIARSTLIAMVHRVGRQAVLPAEVGHLGYGQPRNWSGYMHLDEKFVHWGGKTVPVYVATDDESSDIISWRRTADSSEEHIRRFLDHIELEIGYQIKGITTDLDPKIDRVIAQNGKYLHQKCLWHAQEVIDGLLDYRTLRQKVSVLQHQARESFLSLPDRRTNLGYRKRMAIFRHQRHKLSLLKENVGRCEVLRRAVRQMLSENRSIRQAEHRLVLFRSSYKRHYPAVVSFVERHWVGLTNHLRDRKLAQTNNQIENVMKQVERRLKTIEGFKSSRAIDGYLGLLFWYLRL